ncbi:threonine/serine ThrE exporter family protein [Fusibacter sp. JL216-2]|uniref:threonine/serine ThrE exporter family protein n=1 Tax=Fusibacter sp. JL216-2 TaxID=3071453 RepID=UPI003D3549FB
MLTKDTTRQVLDIAILAGQIMLENGAETYRVEETIEIICKSRGLTDVHGFTIPTGIFLSCRFEDKDFSYVRRLRSSIIDLHIISMVNDFSRTYVNSDIPYEEAIEQLQQIRKAPHFPPLLQYCAGGIAGGFFSVIYGGNAIEAMLSFITSFMVMFTVHQISKKTKAFFLKNLGGGMVNTLLAMLLTDAFSYFGIYPDINIIIIGAVMPLVPGVAITNALRDTISGDFVSGVSKLSEAFGIAIAIALGVGTILHLRLLITGGVL